MTDTLRIAELPAGGLGGLIGLTLAPGKKQTGGMSGGHDRDSRLRRGLQWPEASPSCAGHQVVEAGHLPNARSTTASSNSPVAGLPVRQKATAPADVCHAPRRALRCAGGLPILRFTGDKLAFLVSDERHRHEISHIRRGFSPLSLAFKSAWRSASLGFASRRKSSTAHR